MVSEDRKNEMTTDTFLKSQRITRIKTNKNNYSCHSRNSLNHWLILFAITFLSCQSAPKTPDMFPDDAGFIPLEPGARIYMVTDVQNARPILNNLNFININNEQFQQMLDQTRFATAAVYQTDNLRGYRLAAWGNYPVSRAKMALGASKDWQKQRSSIAADDYWYSANGGLSIAITTGRAFAAAAAGNVSESSPNLQSILFPPRREPPYRKVLTNSARGRSFHAGSTTPAHPSTKNWGKWEYPLSFRHSSFLSACFPWANNCMKPA